MQMYGKECPIDNLRLLSRVERKEELEIKNQKLVNAFQNGLTEHMEELRTLVVAGVDIQQQQLLALEEQLQTFLNFKDQVLRKELN